MPLNSLGLGYVFTATDAASSVMGTVEKNLKKLEEVSGKSIGGLSKNLKMLGAGVALTTVGVGGLGASFALANKAGEFEQSLAAVGAISRASSEDMQKLENAAIKAGIATQFSPVEAIEGLTELSQAGFDVDESIRLLTPALDMAAGSLGKLGPQEASGLAVQALRAFGVESKYAGAAVDQMARSVNMFSMNAGDLPLGLGTASRGAQALNQTLTETLVAFGLVKNTVPSTERASTAVATAMSEMVKPEVQKRLKSIGVQVVDSTGNFRSFLDVIGDMPKALSKVGDTAQQSAFLQKTFSETSIAAVNSFLTQMEKGKVEEGVMRKGKDFLNYYKGALMDSEGAAKDFSKRMLDNFAGQQTLLAGSMSTFAIQMGKPFAQAMRPAVEGMISLLNKMIDVMDSLSPQTKLIASVTFVAVSAFAALGGGLLMFVALLPIMSALLPIGIGMLSSFAVAAWAAVAPLLPFVAAAAAVGFAFMALKNNWFGVTDAFTHGMETIKSWISDAKRFFTPWVDGAKNMMSDFGAALFDGAADAVEMLTAPIRWYIDKWKAMFSFIGDLTGAFGDLMLAGLNWVGAQIASSDLWKSFIVGIDIVKEWFGTIADAVGDVVIQVSAWFESMWSDAVSMFDAFLANWMEGAAFLASPFITAFGVVKGVVASVMDWVMGKIRKFVGLLNGITTTIGEVADKVGGFIGGLPSWLRSKAQNIRDATPGAPAATGGAATVGGPAPAMPAAAAAEGLSASLHEATGQGASFDYEKLAAANARQPLVTTVELDGDVLAKVQERRGRSRMGRGSLPVAGAR